MPLIAVRRGYPNEPDVAKYYPVDLSFPVTVLMRPQGDLLSQNQVDRSVHKKAVLEIYDPLTITDIVIAQHQVPLESDLSTPLAFFLSKPELAQLPTLGLLTPDDMLKKNNASRKFPDDHGPVHDAALRNLAKYRF